MLRLNPKGEMLIRTPIVFTDRDGTIIEDRGHIADIEQVAILPEAVQAIRLLNEMKVPVVLVTNQSGIGRGLVSEEEYWTVHRFLEQRLLEAGASLSAHVYCPDVPEHGVRRKPSPMMFLEAAGILGIDPFGAAFIGDQLRDVAVAPLFRGTAWLVSTGHMLPQELPQWVRRVPTILDAVRKVAEVAKATKRD